MGFGVSALALAGCLSAGTRSAQEQLEREMEEIDRRAEEAAARDDDPFAERVRPDELIRYAQDHNPGLRAARHEAHAALARFGAAASWDPPTLTLMGENLPEMMILRLAQMIPLFGRLDDRARSALEEADAALERYREKEGALRAEAAAAYGELAMAHFERRIHEEFLAIYREEARTADALYRTGRISAREVTEAQLALSAFFSGMPDGVMITEQKIASARARLEQLLHRPAGRGWAEPVMAEEPVLEIDLAALEERALRDRPELKAMEAMVRAARADVGLMEADRSRPGVMVEGGVRKSRDEGTGVDAGVSAELPWLSGKRAAQVDEAKARLAAAEAALESARDAARAAVRDSAARRISADRRAAHYAAVILPQMEERIRAARAEFATGRLDPLALNMARHALHDAKMELARARVEQAVTRYEMERLTGMEGPQ